MPLRYLKPLTYCAALFAISIAQAHGWVCSKADLVREVTVFYPDAPAQLPCRVYYSKSTEHAMPRVLWDATKEENYCERKAQAFVRKLRTMGWSCSEETGESRSAGAD